jgi:uncharacterized protein (TIGR03437 family)
MAYNIGDGELALALSIPSWVHWLSAAVGDPQPCPSSTYTCNSLQFNLDTASLLAGSYTATVTVSDPLAVDAPQVITVSIFVAGGPPAIDVQMSPGTTADFHFPSRSTICPRGCSTPVATVVNASEWLTATIIIDASSTTYLSWHWQIHLAPPVGMPDRTYKANITANDSITGFTIPVTMRIGGPAPVFASPDHIDVRAAQDGPPVTAPFLSPIHLATPDSDSVPVQSVATYGAGISATLSSGDVILTVDPVGLVGRTHTGHITVNCDADGCPFDVPVSLEVLRQGPPEIQGVTSPTTLPGYTLVAPGEIMIIRGEQLSRSPAAFASATPLPLTLGGVAVTVNRVGAPLFYSSAGQVSFQLPYDTTAGTAQVQLFRDGQPSNSVPINVVPRAAAILAVTGMDYSTRDSSHPANPGEPLIIWAVGLGQTIPAVPTGDDAPSDPPAAVIPSPMIYLGGSKLPAGFAGLAPGQVGVYQVNFTVPSDAAKGTSLVAILQGDNLSDYASIAIR